MRITCFKHVPFEGPAVFADWAETRGHSMDCIEVYAADALPEPEAYDLLLVMGGPMNIYQESLYPWLSMEKSALRAAIAAGKYVVGVCLGAQLIADALGSKVAPGAEKEIGWFPITREADCPAMLNFPESLEVYHWHGDTFKCPEGATRIARSRACANQGFLYQERVLGLQCHLESTPESITALIEACRDEIVEGPYTQSADRMQLEKKSTFDSMHAVLYQLMDRLTTDG